MEPTNVAENALLQKLKKEVDDNLTNDQFSVEELARNIGMSRSQLHRKLVTATGQSVSQFIREYRLQLGMELLKRGDLTAAEVSERIGFGSATYFNKCFNEFYGFPPGEVKNKMAENLGETKVFTPVTNVTRESGTSTRSYLKWIAVVSAFIIFGIIYRCIIRTMEKIQVMLRTSLSPYFHSKTSVKTNKTNISAKVSLKQSERDCLRSKSSGLYQGHL